MFYQLLFTSNITLVLCLFLQPLPLQQVTRHTVNKLGIHNNPTLHNNPVHIQHNPVPTLHSLGTHSKQDTHNNPWVTHNNPWATNNQPMDNSNVSIIKKRYRLHMSLSVCSIYLPSVCNQFLIFHTSNNSRQKQCISSGECWRNLSASSFNSTYRKINVMDKIWDRKSEVIGRCGENEKNEWPKSNGAKKNEQKKST